MDAREFHTDRTPLAGRRVLITGGTTGIGRAAAGLLAAEGARVFVFGRNADPLEETLAAVRSLGGDIAGTTADVADPDDVARVLDEASAHLGGLDVLVNNAGIGGDGLADMTDGDWRYVLDTNLVGFMAFAKGAAERMTAGGHMILVGSVSADHRSADSSVYVATKAGIQGFAESFGKEMQQHDIKVTLIEPGAVGTDMTDMTADEQKAAIAEHRLLRAEDIAVAMHYVLTQPPRCLIAALTVTERRSEEED